MAFTSFLPLKDHSSMGVCFFGARVSVRAHECLCARTCSKLLTHSLYKPSSVLQQLENKSIVTTSIKHWIMISMLLPNVLFSRVCVCVFVFVPNMMPLGFVGGCQTTLSDDNRTSGNTILTGGPGTAEKNREGSWQQIETVIICTKSSREKHKGTTS